MTTRRAVRNESPVRAGEPTFTGLPVETGGYFLFVLSRLSARECASGAGSAPGSKSASPLSCEGRGVGSERKNKFFARAGARFGVWGPMPGSKPASPLSCGAGALDQKEKTSFSSARERAHRGVGVAKGGRALEKAEKTCFFWLRQPYSPLWSSFFASVSFSRERNAEKRLLSYSEVKYV